MMNEMDTYSIGDAARRTGLAVSAIRFYADEGIVAPALVTDAGHRRYDLAGIAQLELVRTLRSLDAPLDEIRRVVTGEAELSDIVRAHLAIVEREAQELGATRAVLRVLAAQDGPDRRIELMRSLARMSDVDRRRVIDEFWSDVTADLAPATARRLHRVRPELPDDPTTEQLVAWIELGELVQRRDFRDETRAYLADVYAGEPWASLDADLGEDDEPGWFGAARDGSLTRVFAAVRSGLPADSEHARGLADELLREFAELGGSAAPELRLVLAEQFASMHELILEMGPDVEFERTYGRYLALVAAINGMRLVAGGPVAADDPVLRDADIDLATVGPWLAQALRPDAALDVS